MLFAALGPGPGGPARGRAGNPAGEGRHPAGAGGAMANMTDPVARAIHGTNPQNLMENILRQKIYELPYWKEQCFAQLT